MVAGIGNVLAGDDGLGPTVIRTFVARFVVPPDVEILDAGTPGMDLVALVGDAELLVVVDTVAADAAPGAIRVYDRPALLARPLTPRVNPHAPGLVESLLSMDLAGGGPSGVWLVGVVPLTTPVGVGLSAPVQAAVPEAVEAVRRILVDAGIEVAERTEPDSPDLWWETARGRFVEGSGEG